MKKSYILKHIGHRATPYYYCGEEGLKFQADINQAYRFENEKDAEHDAMVIMTNAPYIDNLILETIFCNNVTTA